MIRNDSQHSWFDGTIHTWTENVFLLYHYAFFLCSIAKSGREGQILCSLGIIVMSSTTNCNDCHINRIWPLIVCVSTLYIPCCLLIVERVRKNGAKSDHTSSPLLVNLELIRHLKNRTITTSAGILEK